MKNEFWYNKKVLVTGHTGFKGSWLSLWLQSQGANVTGLSLEPPTEPSLFTIAKVAEGMISHIGDIRDLDVVKQVFNETKPEIVIHMAAQALVLYSYQNPVETFASNVMGTVHVLEACRQTASVRSAVMVTSDKCYENKEWFWGYRENEAMGGYDPYSSSKGCSELVANAYRQSFFHENGAKIGLATVRAGNVIGGGDWAADRLIPDFMKSIMAGEAVVIRSPRSIRPWQHVLEPIVGYLELAQRLWEKPDEFEGGWNFGPYESDAKEVQWIVERISKIWGKGAEWRLDDKLHPHEANYLKLDCTKARTLLDWQPRLDLSTTLEWIVSWYQNYRDKSDMREITMQEIARFEKLKKGSE